MGDAMTISHPYCEQHKDVARIQYEVDDLKKRLMDLEKISAGREVQVANMETCINKIDKKLDILIDKPATQFSAIKTALMITAGNVVVTYIMYEMFFKSIKALAGGE